MLWKAWLRLAYQQQMRCGKDLAQETGEEKKITKKQGGAPCSYYTAHRFV